jgi:hypothetical protein
MGYLCVCLPRRTVMLCFYCLATVSVLTVDLLCPIWPGPVRRVALHKHAQACYHEHYAAPHTACGLHRPTREATPHLVCDVLPVVWAAKVLQVLPQQATHVHDALRHHCNLLQGNTAAHGSTAHNSGMISTTAALKETASHRMAASDVLSAQEPAPDTTGGSARQCEARTQTFNATVLGLQPTSTSGFKVQPCDRPAYGRALFGSCHP